MQNHFPRPIHLTPGCSRWRLSDLEKFDARAECRPEPVQREPEDERFLSVNQVATRYAVSIQTIHRWASPKQRKSPTPKASQATQ